MENQTIHTLGKWAHEEAESILSWWLEHVIDKENGGFYGYAGRDGTPKVDADRHLVLGSRLVWTFSTAYRIFKKPEYKQAADYFYNYFVENFWDKQYGGAYWELTNKSQVKQERKQTYGQAFTLYALSEYARATGHEGAKKLALQQFDLLEKYVYDAKHGGYREGLLRDWSVEESMGTSSVNPHNAVFTMNTSLHLIEAYTNLLRIENTPVVRAAVEKHLQIMTTKVMQPNHRFALFFDGNWQRNDTIISYGHDIEGSWLLYETAEVLGDAATMERLKKLSIGMADAVMDGGIDPKDGALYNEIDYKTGHLDASKVWWQQSESAVGFFNAYQLSGEQKHLEATLRVVEFIKTSIKDPVHGEWFGAALDAASPHHFDEKITGWKCPYHNSRMCFELMERCEKMEEK